MILLGGTDYSSRYEEPVPPPLVWEELEPHPQVMAQPASPDSSGRYIKSMKLSADGTTMLLGFGDYGANTGPIAVCGYDAESGEPVTLFESAPTEAIYRWKEYDGHDYAPWVDPEWYYGPGGYTTNESGSWENVQVGDMVHTFDLVKFNGRLILAGSQLTDLELDIAGGCIWTQVDGVWDRYYIHGGSSRCYRLIERDGRLWTRAISFDNGSVLATLSSEDGVTWTPSTWTGSMNFDQWGDLGSQKSITWNPDGLTTLSSLGNGYVWCARADGTVSRALLNP